MLRLKNVSAGYSGKTVVKNANLTVSPQKLLILLGENGCGKSTLLKTACGILPKMSGEILLNGKPLESYSAKKAAQRIAFLPQSRPVPDMTARSMVLHGRFPHLGYPRRYKAEDYDIVDEALRAVDAADIADKLLTKMSGGERQKVYLAMALAQQTDVILMDEPTTYLDLRHQLETMQLLRKFADSGKAIALILHDIPLALQTADEIAVISDGEIKMTASPDEVFQSGILQSAMGITLRQAATVEGVRYFCALEQKGD